MAWMLGEDSMMHKEWIHKPSALDDTSTPHWKQTLYVHAAITVGERRLCIEQTISRMPSSSASSPHDCDYGGLQVRKSYPWLICRRIVLDQIGTHFRVSTYTWVHMVVVQLSPFFQVLYITVLTLKWRWCIVAMVMHSVRSSRVHSRGGC